MAPPKLFWGPRSGRLGPCFVGPRQISCANPDATIHRAEAVNGKTAMTFANAAAVRRVLEAAGVELLDENGGGPGARLKRKAAD
jgi:hypothetical protein